MSIEGLILEMIQVNRYNLFEVEDFLYIADRDTVIEALISLYEQGFITGSPVFTSQSGRTRIESFSRIQAI